MSRSHSYACRNPAKGSGIKFHGISEREKQPDDIRTVPGKMCIRDRIGTIEAGKLADIVAFDASPMDDIKVMANCSFVMKDGVVYKG